jgi:phage terminase small subunit
MRGRRALPPEIKALKGNPGKRRLALNKAGKRAVAAVVARPQIAPPEFLTQDGEIKAFRWVYETLPANLARASDVMSVARWASWLNVWISCKTTLDGKAFWYESQSNHGKLMREHPISKKMDRAEGHLIALEDRLGLNIVARNNIVHRLFQMPAAPPGELFDDKNADKKEPGESPPPPVDQLEQISPLGFMAQAGKQHSTH